MRLNEKELKQIKGGISAWAIVAGIAGLIFGFGAFDGYVRPVKCRK
mgnify:CR=1 FL=1